MWEDLRRARGPDTELPYWGIVWPGGRVVARYVLDYPEDFSGKRVMDLATGSGMVAAALARVGAFVTALDIDPDALLLAAHTARANGVRFKRKRVAPDFLETRPPFWDAAGRPIEMLLAGDVFYEEQFAAAALRFLRRAREAGLRVIVGDPARSYSPVGRPGFRALASGRAPVIREIEGTAMRDYTVFELE